MLSPTIGADHEYTFWSSAVQGMCLVVRANLQLSVSCTHCLTTRDRAFAVCAGGTSVRLRHSHRAVLLCRVPGAFLPCPFSRWCSCVCKCVCRHAQLGSGLLLRRFVGPLTAIWSVDVQSLVSEVSSSSVCSSLGPTHAHARTHTHICTYIHGLMHSA